jgi:flagellar basal body-associated protein FliL
MLRRALIAASVLMAVSGAPAGAAPAGPAQVGQYVDLQPIPLPIVARGQLVNYVFVYVRVNLAANADVNRLRDKEPQFRDSLVRMAHRTPFIVAGDYNRIDEERLDASLLREVQAIAGEGAIRSVVVSSQAPQHRIPNPRN